MDRMPTFDNATATLEIEPVEDMPRQDNEKIEPVVERETPFLPPKSVKQAKPKKPMTEKQAAHMERMRMRKLELQAARQGKKYASPNPPTKKEPIIEEEVEVVEEPKKAKPKEAKPSGKAGAVNVELGFENWLNNYEMMKKIEFKIQEEERAAREAEDRKKAKEAEKERGMEERLRKKILAEQQNRKMAPQPRRWTPSTKQPIPTTQGHLQTQSEDFGIYSNRYF